MSNKDFLFRVKADTKNYDANLAKAKKQLDGFAKANLSAGGAIKQLSGQLVSTATKFASVTAVVGGSLKVVKDAFFANEQNLDEWGRTVRASESLYKGFLNSLNTGNISGFLSNMNDIVNAARAAYNAMDELNTFNAFNQVNESKAQMNLSESIVNFREGNGSKELIRSAADTYISELRKRAEKEQETYETAIAELAARRGVTTEGLRSVLTGTYDEYIEAKGVQPTGKKNVSRGPAFWATLGGGTDYSVEKAVAIGEAEKLGEMLRNLNDTELQAVQALGKAANVTGNQIMQTERMVSRAMNARPLGGTTTNNKVTPTEKIEPFIAPDMSDRGLEWQSTDLLEKVKEINANPVNIAPPEVLAPLQQMESYADRIREKMQMAASPEQYATLAKALEGVQQNIDEFTGKKNPGEQMADGFSAAARSISSVCSALASLEDPAARVAGIIAEAIANIALTFSQSLKGTVTPWDWIAGAVAGTATMISTITAIKSATAGSYATGGVIPGNSYSGDNQIAMVNAGETILTRAQTNQLASSLQSRAAESQSRPYVTGESIYLGLNNYLKATGRGSLITSRG